MKFICVNCKSDIHLKQIAITQEDNRYPIMHDLVNVCACNMPHPHTGMSSHILLNSTMIFIDDLLLLRHDCMKN